MSTRRSTVDEYPRAAFEFENWLATQAERGVPELRLLWLIKHYASVIEEQGFIPRTWLEPRRPTASLDWTASEIQNELANRDSRT